MILDTSSSVSLPQINSRPSASFYPFPISPRTQVHNAIRGLAPLPPGDTDYPASGSNPAFGHGSVATPGRASGSGSAGPGPATERQARQAERNAYDRALRRALAGKRPAGVAVGREGEELSDEEEALGAENQMVTQFGHRFLLPIGRRLTQMEMDAAASPTPSQPDDERRQEDRNVASASPLVGGQSVLDGEGGADGQEGQVVDLDASIEDLDVSGDLDESGHIEDLAGGDDGDEEMEESMEQE